MRFENPPEESPDVPPLMIVVQQDRFHLILVIIGIIIRRLLGQKLKYIYIFILSGDGLGRDFLHLSLP